MKISNLRALGAHAPTHARNHARTQPRTPHARTHTHTHERAQHFYLYAFFISQIYFKPWLGFGEKGNGAASCELNVMLEKNPIWMDASKGEREAWINQLGNGVKLHVRQGCATDQQWTLLGIPEDIDKQQHTTCALNRQRTVRLTHPARMAAVATHSESLELHNEDEAAWDKEKAEFKKMNNKCTEAYNERLAEKKRNADANTACVCGIKQNVLNDEIRKAKSGYNIIFKECGGGKGTCSVGGILHNTCIAKHSAKFGVVDGKTYCMWCLKEEQNPKPAKMRPKPKPPTVEVEAMPVKDENTLLEKADKLIRRSFPSYVPADMPSQIQKDLEENKLVPIDLEALEIEDTIVDDHTYENVSDDEEDTTGIGLGDDDDTSDPSSSSLSSIARVLDSVHLYDDGEESSESGASSQIFEPGKIGGTIGASSIQSLTEHVSPPSQEMTD